MTELSPCYVSQGRDTAEVLHALNTARAQGLTVIAHAAGHSYTDAALNTNGVIIDVTGMRRILCWDPQRGVMKVEPGVTMREMVRISLPDRWWPAITPSTADATVGGCVALNVTGKNAWKCGSFGEQVLSLTVLLAGGELLTVSPAANSQLFYALVGSAGLLGIITSVTLQLRRLESDSVDMWLRPASALGELLEIFEEEQPADFLEAWVDGFAGGSHLGRGFVTSTKHSDMRDDAATHGQASPIPEQLQERLARWAGRGGRLALNSSVRMANSALYAWSSRRNSEVIQRRSLLQSTFYSRAAYEGFRNLLTRGIETFQAFVPRSQTEDVFREIMRRSQASNFMPLWCVIKQHRRDPFLLSYQVDGFSLELNYAHIPHTINALRKMLRDLMDLVLSVGGRFYLAKDSILTGALYRRSAGDRAVEAFLGLKQQLDPEMLFQSNLFRRVFQPSQ